MLNRADFSTVYGNWRSRQRLKSYGSPVLNNLYKKILREADMERVRKLQKDVEAAYVADPSCAAKYAFVDHWLLFNIGRAAALNLHVSDPLKVLDIGCGPGFFLFAARALGHDCHGVDAPEEYFTEVERLVYHELLSAFHAIECRSPLLVERYVPLPVADADLDLITGFTVCFNQHEKPDEWEVEEWQFF